MQKIILSIFFLLSINVYALERVECEELFKKAIFNFYLENSCKFDKHVASTIRKEFETQNCTKMFSDEDMKKLNSEVLGESYQKMKKIGRDDFCQSNRAKYEGFRSL